MAIENLLVRASQLTGAYGNTGHPPERVDVAAIAAGHCALINIELELFIRFCYVKQGERFIHLSGNSQIPQGVFTPWGSKGALTRTESDTIRTYLLRIRDPHKLFFYVGRRWYVDTFTYPDLASALAWLTKYKITADRWLQFSKTNLFRLPKADKNG
jgi:hypothetical protein